MATIRNLIDTYVSEANPSLNYGRKQRLWISASGGTPSNERFIYIFFAASIAGKNVISAKLRFYNGAAWSGAVTVTAERLNEEFKVNREKYTGRPGVVGPAYTVAKTGAAAKTEWEIDITGMMQTVAAGGVWFGLRLSATGSTGKWIHSAQATNTDLRPYVILETTDAPLPPESLAPSGNRAVSVSKPTLSYVFTDTAGDKTLVAHEIHVGSTQSIVDAGNAEWKSGELATTVAELDLAGTAYPGLTNGSTAWWRVRVKDGAGLWSAWSESVQFKRTDKSALTLTNPPVGSPSSVGDPTFPAAWTFAGTQTAWRVFIRRVDAAAPTADNIYDSGKITDTTTSWTIPEQPAKTWVKNATYRITLQVWDNVDRQKEGSRPIWTEVSRDFVFTDDATVPKPTNLTFTKDSLYPTAILDFTLATMPDYLNIYRGDDLIASRVVPNDILVSGTSYRFIDRTVPPRVTNVWNVEAVVNGKASQPVTVQGSIKPTSLWLMEPDGDNAILLMNPNYDPERGEESAVHKTLASAAPVLVSQAIRGWEGHVSGVLADDVVPGVTARMMRDRFKQLRKKRGATLLLYMVDEAFEVFIDQATYKPIADPYGVKYFVEFDFYEVNFK